MRSQFKIFIIIGAISLFFACASTPVPIYHTIQIDAGPSRRIFSHTAFS